MVGQGTDDCKVPEPIDGTWHMIIPREIKIVETEDEIR